MATPYLIDYPKNYTNPAPIATEYSLFDVYMPYEYPFYSGNAEVTITYPDGTSESYQTNYITQVPNTLSLSQYNIKVRSGMTKVQYNILYQSIAGSIGKRVYYTFTIYGVENKYPLVPWSVQDVIERILDLQQPLLYNKTRGEFVATPRFKFDLSKISADKQILFTRKNSPEFTFTRQTLREALKTIGGFIHAEPRLLYNEETGEFDTITFDFFGEQEYAYYYDVNLKTQRRLSEYNYEDKTLSWNIEQACNELDAYVDNLVNRIKRNTATVGQPYEGSYQTFRTESAAARLEEENMYLPTVYPISSIKSLSWINSADGKKYDITAYLYEKSVYDSQLSSYEDVYPISKAYGLYYTPSGQGIYGFFFKRESLKSAWENYAIVNIIKRATGIDVIDGVSNDDLIGVYRNLRFEVVYTPIYSARVQHSKQYVGDWLLYPRTLNYAQSANQVETEYFGENIKGAVERLGTLEKLITFTCFNIETIPSAGLLWDDEYYISTVSVEVMHDKFKVTCGLSKNFNRISQYIGVSSYKRTYEVSEVMVQTRENVWKDYVLFTDYKTSAAVSVQEDCLLNRDVMYTIRDTFLQDETIGNFNKVTAVHAYGVTKNYAELTHVVLPVIASVEGNVIEFSWEYKDNYSAGIRAVEVDSDYYGQDVQYSDYYGRIYYYNWHLGYHNQVIDPTAYPQYIEVMSSVTGIIPGINNIYGTDNPLSDEDKVYQFLRKDSRETVKMNVLIEFVTDKKEFVIGSALASLNPMVSGIIPQTEDAATSVLLVALRKRINKLTRIINKEDIIVSYEISKENFSVADGTLSFAPVRYAPEDGEPAQAWAFIRAFKMGLEETYETENGEAVTVAEEEGGNLLLGCNSVFGNGSDIGGFTAYALHDVYRYLKNKT